MSKLHEGLKKIFMGEAFSQEQNLAARAVKSLVKLGAEVSEVDEMLGDAGELGVQATLSLQHALKSIKNAEKICLDFLKKSGVNY